MVVEISQGGLPRSALGDLVKISSVQVRPQEHREDIYNYIALENIESGTGRLINFAPVKGKFIESNKFAFEKGDILYGRLRPYLRKAIIAPFDGICATEIIPLKPLDGVNSEYLREFLLSPFVARHVEGLVAGARMPRLRTSDLLEIPVPLPDATEQATNGLSLLTLRYQTRLWDERLAAAEAKLERARSGLLSRAEVGRWSPALRVPSEDGGEEFLKALLDQRRQTWEEHEKQRLMASGSLLLDESWKLRYPEPAAYSEDDELPDLPERWVWASLSQLTSAVSPIGYGVVQPGEEPETGVNLIRVQDLKNGGIDTSQLRKISDHVSENYARSILKGGELLVSLVGTIGKTAIVPQELSGANIARALAKITPTSDVVRDWLAICLNAQRIQNWMSSGAREVARKTLNISSLERAPIPIGPVSDLVRFTQGVSIIDRNLESIRTKIANARMLIQRVEELWQNKVFDGFRMNIKSGEDHVSRARRWVNTPERRDHSMTQERRGATAPRIAPKSVADRQPKDLVDVVRENGGKMSPLDLLMATGYGLERIEVFYRKLADSIRSGHLRDSRPDNMSSIIELP